LSKSGKIGKTDQQYIGEESLMDFFISATSSVLNERDSLMRLSLGKYDSDGGKKLKF
jgi:hypothetical protein